MTEYRRLDELCHINMGQSPDSKSYNEYAEGLPFFQGNADFGVIYPTARVWCSSPTKVVEPGTLLISVRAPIGALNFAKERSCIGRGLAGITPHHGISTKFIYYALKGKHKELNAKGTGSTFKAIAKNALGETLVKVASKAEQMEIVQTLDKVSGAIEARKQQLQKLDELVKARFVEMFGDPVQNKMKWPVKSLLDMGYCKNGMNFRTGDSGIEIHCLGVGDFKNLSIIDETDRLPTISLNEEPPKECLLQDGDIVFVRSNGNKALVGRCLIVYPDKIPTTYSGFCIRYRLTVNDVETQYLLSTLKTDSVRKKIVGRGVNIQNLNQQTLGSLSIPIPPKNMQQQFVAFVTQIDKSKEAVQQALDKTQQLFDSLMQQYFA